MRRRLIDGCINVSRTWDKMHPIYAFSKRIKEQQVSHHAITDDVDVTNIQLVTQKLLALPKVSKSSIDELDLNTNARKWATSLIRNFPSNVNKDEMGYLLNDFTESMRTRMREESKYAIGLLMESGLLLCHSAFGEETITPEWKTIPRMLDTDNVLRYVYFISEKGTINVEYWEREATSSFVEWLGLPQKVAFLFGGRYRIFSQIEGVTTELQLTDSEMENLISSHPEFKDGTIKLSTPIQILNVAEVRVGRKSYENVQDFIQDYDAEKYGIARYAKEYERIRMKALPLLVKYYDEKTRLVRKEEEEEVTEVAKTTPSFDILFVNENIEFRASYLKDIIKRFINNEMIRIFHAGVKFKASPLVLGGLELYNRIQVDSLTQQVIEYYKDTGLQDRNLATLIKYVVLKKLADTNQESPLVHFFQPLCNEILRSVASDKKWSKLEDKVLEYKSASLVDGDNGKVIDRLKDDLIKKLKESPFKIYCVGVEDDGTVNPVPSSRLKSDRIETIRKGLERELTSTNIYICSVPQASGSMLLILASVQ